MSLEDCFGTSVSSVPLPNISPKRVILIWRTPTVWRPVVGGCCVQPSPWVSVDPGKKEGP